MIPVLKMHSNTTGPNVNIQISDNGSFILIIKSNPFISRDPALAELATRLSWIGQKPFIVLGDFNTPPDSVHFEPMRRLAKRAFERFGSGYAPSGPPRCRFLNWTKSGSRPSGGRFAASTAGRSTSLVTLNALPEART